MQFSKNRLKVLRYWITERESIRIRKEVQRLPKPWTNDPLMANTRWCNVRRMDDRVSRWLMDYFYQITSKHAVTATALARLINWPDTLTYLYPKGWNGEWNPHESNSVRLALNDRYLDGQKIFTGAYIINAANATDEDREGGGAKIKVIVRIVDAVHKHRNLLDSTSMENTWRNLQEVQGIGGFIAGQIVADLRHTVIGDWNDKDTWAPHGPGSIRGLAWLSDKEGRMSPLEFRRRFNVLLPIVKDMVPDIYSDRRLEAMDIQNCLCELSKLVRLRAGGRSKNKYAGGLS